MEPGWDTPPILWSLLERYKANRTDFGDMDTINCHCEELILLWGCHFGIIPLAFSPGNWFHCLPVAPVLRCSGPSSKPGSNTGPLMIKLIASRPSEHTATLEPSLTCQRTQDLIPHPRKLPPALGTTSSTSVQASHPGSPGPQSYTPPGQWKLCNTHLWCYGQLCQ